MIPQGKREINSPSFLQAKLQKLLHGIPDTLSYSGRPAKSQEYGGERHSRTLQPTNRLKRAKVEPVTFLSQLQNFVKKKLHHAAEMVLLSSYFCLYFTFYLRIGLHLFAPSLYPNAAQQLVFSEFPNGCVAENRAMWRHYIFQGRSNSSGRQTEVLGVTLYRL